MEQSVYRLELSSGLIKQWKATFWMMMVSQNTQVVNNTVKMLMGKVLFEVVGLTEIIVCNNP